MYILSIHIVYTWYLHDEVKWTEQDSLKVLEAISARLQKHLLERNCIVTTGGSWRIKERKKRSYQPQILRLLSIWFSTQKRSEHGHLYDSTPLSHLQLPTSTSHQDQAAHRLQRLMSPRSSSCYPAGCRNKTGRVDDWFSRKQGFLDFQLDSLQAAI